VFWLRSESNADRSSDTLLPAANPAGQEEQVTHAILTECAQTGGVPDRSIYHLNKSTATMEQAYVLCAC
jgi:hypothetical protein